MRDISALRKRANPPIDGRGFLEITRAAATLDAEELIPVLEDVLGRLSRVPDEGPRRLRLLMSGGIIADGDRRVLDLVEDEIGAAIVAEDHCTGLSPFYQDTDATGDPWKALADSYLDRAPCARQVPLEKRVQFAVDLAREYKVDGVLFTYLKFCPRYGLTKGKFINAFQAAGFPVLELGTDYSQGDVVLIKTRVEAFIEVLTEKAEA